MNILVRDLKYESMIGKLEPYNCRSHGASNKIPLEIIQTAVGRKQMVHQILATLISLRCFSYYNELLTKIYACLQIMTKL